MNQPVVLVPCQARPDASCLSFCSPAALRLRLHSDAMRPQLRLAGRQNYFAILRHFLLDRTLVVFIGHNDVALPSQYGELKKMPTFKSLFAIFT